MNSGPSATQSAPIHIIGLGTSEHAELSQQAETALLSSDYVYGSARQLSTLSRYLNKPDSAFATLKLPKLQLLEQQLLQRGQSKIAVLASGDPLFYGIGGWLCRHFPQQELIFHAAVSSVQSACHRLGLSLQSVHVVSLHGRPLATLRRELKPNNSLAILTDSSSQPIALASECVRAGLQRSRITVCENLGYATERIRSFSATELMQTSLVFEPLHISIIQVIGSAHLLPQFPGFDDSLFETGAPPGSGMISKREVRLQILSFLQPGSGDVIWDIGAGCGGVAVELAYWNSRTQIHAIEQHPQRLECLRINRERFGVLSNLNIVEGRAPDCLGDLPHPTKIFIGGSDGGLDDIMDLSWNRLADGGMLVASAVTANSRQRLRDFAERTLQCAAEYVELSVQRNTLSEQGWLQQCKRPVAIFKFRKIAVAQ